MDSNNRVLVIAPHALDEMLGCGGTILKAKKAGVLVELIVMCGDGHGRDGERRDANAIVSERLGIRSVRFGGFPENRSDTIPLVDMVTEIEKAKREFLPDTVYVCHGDSLHIDHQKSFEAAMTALRPVPGSSVRNIFGYEIQSSTEWTPNTSSSFIPSRFVDISDTINEKIELMALYGEEMRPEPHARSLKSSEYLARLRGASVGVQAAEAFSVIRQIC